MTRRGLFCSMLGARRVAATADVAAAAAQARRFGLEAGAVELLLASDLRRTASVATAMRAATAVQVEAMRAELCAIRALIGGGRP